MKLKFLSVMIKLSLMAVMAVLLLSCDTPESKSNDANPDTGGSGVQATIILGPVSGNVEAGVYIWVTDTNDTFVRTLDYFTKNGRGTLYQHSTGDNPTSFKTITGNSTTDAVTRATQNVSSSIREYISKKWDLTDSSGNTVDNGTYRIHVEITSYHDGRNYYTGDIAIDGSSENTVNLTSVSGTNIMKSGTVTYIP